MRQYWEKSSYNWSEDSVRIITTPSTFAKASLYYVQEAGLFQTLPGYFTERVNLDSYLILYTTSGTGSLIYGDKTYPLLPGQICYIDCRQYQYYRTDPDDPWEVMWIHFNGSSSLGYYEQFARASSPSIMLNEESRMPNLMREIISLHQHRTIQTELSGSRLIADLLTELLLTVQYLDTSKAGIPEIVRDVMSYYDRHYSEKISLADISTVFAIDKYHLSKAFKHHTGFSPNDYLINTRITRAKELLRFSDKSVIDIATDVGIDNVSHFINLFRNRETHTPLAYRKHWQDN